MSHTDHVEHNVLEKGRDQRFFGNWLNHYGRYYHDPDDGSIQIDESVRLTPKQRKRIQHKINRAEMLERTGVKMRYQSIVRFVRRQEGNKRRAGYLARFTTSSKPTVGEGTVRARQRERKLFGRDRDKLFDRRGQVRPIDPKSQKRINRDGKRKRS